MRSRLQRLIAFFSIYIFSFAGLYAQKTPDASLDFSRGEEYFRRNRAETALPFLEKAAESEDNPVAFVYLALVYYQLGMYRESLAASEKGITIPGADKKVLAFNAGNTAFALELYDDAENWYSMAIDCDETYSAPVLNRANVRLENRKLEAAREDYLLYLEMEPETPQREEILSILESIEEELKKLGSRIQPVDPADIINVSMEIFSANEESVGAEDVNVKPAVTFKSKNDTYTRNEEAVDTDDLIFVVRKNDSVQTEGVDAEDIIQAVRMNDAVKTEAVDGDDLFFVVRKNDSVQTENVDAEDIIQVVRMNDAVKTEAVDGEDLIYVVRRNDSVRTEDVDAEDIIQAVRMNDVLKTENVDSDDIIYVVHKTDSKAQESSENLPGEEVYSSEPVDSVMPSESDETDEFDYGKVEPAVSNEK